MQTQHLYLLLSDNNHEHQKTVEEVNSKTRLYFSMWALALQFEVEFEALGYERLIFRVDYCRHK
jgi:hypothetical protein